MCIFENKNEKFVFEKIGLTQKVSASDVIKISTKFCVILLIIKFEIYFFFSKK